MKEEKKERKNKNEMKALHLLIHTCIIMLNCNYEATNQM